MAINKKIIICNLDNKMRGGGYNFSVFKQKGGFLTMNLIICCVLVGAALLITFFTLLLGSRNDSKFSESTITKLTVPYNSFLRKLVLFKEGDNVRTPFLYVRIIPYLLQLLVTIVFVILVLLYQYSDVYIPFKVLQIIALVSFIVNAVHDTILNILARLFKI